MTQGAVSLRRATCPTPPAAEGERKGRRRTRKRYMYVEDEQKPQAVLVVILG